MALVETFPLDIPPGVWRDITAFAAGLKYIDSNLIRFRYGLVETMGGWTKYFATAFGGVPRTILPWAQLDGTLNIAVGTHQTIELLQGGVKYDITPYRALSTGVLGASPFATVNGSPTVTVTHAAHGMSTGAVVWYSNVTAFNGVDMGSFAWEITVTGVNTYTIAYLVNATATSAGGGAAVGFSYDSILLGNNPFSTAAGSATVTVAHVAHGLVAGTSVTYSGVAVFNGVTMNGTWLVASIAGVDAYTITYTSAATGSGSGGGAACIAHANIAAGAVTGASMRIVHLAKFGEDLLLNPSPDGSIYWWDATLGPTKRARILPKAPTADIILVGKDDQHVNAYGTNNDNMAQVWSSQADLSSWTATSTNSSGTKQYVGGSRIMAAVASTREIVVYTDTTLYSQQLIGGNDVYSFTPLGSASILGPLAVNEHNGILRWAGNGQFYKYDGAINVIPCTMQRAVFKDLNTTESRGVVAGLNQEFNEVSFHYTAISTAALVNDSYAKVNFAEGEVWDSGLMDRTAWADRSVIFHPLGASGTGYLYQHEDGIAADTDPLNAYIITGDIVKRSLSGRIVTQYLSRIMFDAVMEGNIDLFLRYRRYPRRDYTVKGPWRITPTTEKVRPRVRGKLISLEWQTPRNAFLELQCEDGAVLTQEDAGSLLSETELRDRTQDLLTFWRKGSEVLYRQDSGLGP